MAQTLLYFSKYAYPLTSAELWFWQHGTSYSEHNSLFMLHASNPKLLNLRKHRKTISKSKWLIARRVGDQLSKIPFIQGIFVTGSLAMSNCTKDADIDLMIITSPNTLWLTRLLVFLILFPIRRRPGVTSAPDRICDNLYLDSNHLSIPHSPSIYLAHEILQAQCIFDRSGTHRQFLLSNSWAKKYLPVAYRESLKNLRPQPTTYNLQLTTTLLYPINLLLFLAQYLYMLPKMTTERVSLGYAFFHPHSSDSTSS